MSIKAVDETRPVIAPWPAHRMEPEDLAAGFGTYKDISSMWLHWSAAQRRLWRQGDTRRRMFA